MKLLKKCRNICVQATITTFKAVRFTAECVVTIMIATVPVPARYRQKYNLTYLLARSAQEHSNIHIAKLLLACGANVNKESEHHTSPLALAVSSGNTAMAEFLIKKGANSLDDALYCSVYQGNSAMTQLLITHGATPSNEETDNLLELADKRWGLADKEREFYSHWYTQTFFDYPITEETQIQQFDDKEKVKTFLIQAKIAPAQVKNEVLPFVPVADIAELIARYSI